MCMEKVLVGLAIDVSASMQESIDNLSTGTTRFDTILDAITKHIQKLRECIQEGNNVKLFAYIFGLNDEKQGAVCDFLGLIDNFHRSRVLDTPTRYNPYERLRNMAKAYDK